jgi:quercetin dioxygenase-like cupin family protein
MPPLNDRKQPYAIEKGEGHAINFGVEFVIKSSEIQSGSGAAVLEYTTCKGQEPSDHTHPTEDEMFYVLDGAITFNCAGKTFNLQAGGFIFLPRGIKHGYTISNDLPVRLLVITSPVRESPAGGWGGFVADMEKAP